MANPFLMDDDVDVGDDNAVNPFLIEDSQNNKAETDNPFIAQANNPFAGFGDEPEDLVQTEAPTTVSDLFQNEESDDDAAMSFFGTTIQEDDALSLELKSQQLAQIDDTVTYSSEDEVNKKKEPPPRPSPPSQQTQDLIFAVSDQLDQASSQMLGRIPVTRTPSPVSMRDLHSPSPTPESAMADLLDVSDDNFTNIDQNSTHSSEITEDPNDNPFTNSAFHNFQNPPPVQPEKPQPPRPPPPRPAAPPRPAPPLNATAPGQISSKPNVHHNNEGDLFDMFGITAPPKPPPPKTNQDILSLFELPAVKPQDQPDLLSDDLVLRDAPVSEEYILTSQEISKHESPEESKAVDFQSDPIFTSTVTEPEKLSKGQDLEKFDVTAETTVMHSIKTELPKRAPTPDIEITTVPDLPRSDDEDDYISDYPKQQEVEDKQNDVEPEKSEEILSNVNTEIISKPVMEATEIRETEQMDTDLDFAPPSGTASANPFASPDEMVGFSQSGNVLDAVKTIESAPAPGTYTDTQISSEVSTNIFANPAQPLNYGSTNIFSDPDEFDAFSAKFDSAKKDNGTLLEGFGEIISSKTDDAWGDSGDAFGIESANVGFDVDEGFDSFLAMKAPQLIHNRRDSEDSDDKEFSVVIRPKEGDMSQGIAPILAPPPPPRGSQNNSIYSGDSSPRINPFDKSDEVGSAEGVTTVPDSAFLKRTDSQETPPTPLFDEDVSQPLEDFPRLSYSGSGWDMQLRQPNKKKITGQRFWKKIYVRLVFQNDIPAVQLFNQATDKTPFQELPLQPSYSVSEIAAQQFDQFGKIFTLKLQYIFYKERPGVRPGQVTKAERITNKLSQFAAYAIQGDYQGVKEFGSDLKKLGLPVEHAPQVSQLFKIGSMSYEDLKQFSVCIEEALFKISAHRDRALNYKSEEVQLTAVDEIYVEQDSEGRVNKQIARVRLFFLGFLSGMPSIELGMNDLWRQGKEVVGRHDIIPVVTEEWIRLEGVEFHNVVHQDEYERSRTIKFQPPDACYIELMRFRVRPPKNRELPFQLKASWCVTGNRVELRADILVPGFASRKLGQIPCEDVSVRFPIPECWIYLFRVEKHFRYGSVKSAHRRTGKIKGIERILGAVETLQESLIEVTSGQAKYEHHHRAIVWRCPRLPKEGQGAYTTHQMVCRMALTSYDQIPEQLAPYAFVEFTMPATQVSHTTVRSVSVQDSDSDDPPEKYVRYLARHEYRVGIETTQGESPNAYLAATRTIKEEAPPPVQPVATPMAPSDSDSDSN